MGQHTVDHYPFPAGIHVEVIIDDRNGDIATRSVEFDVTDTDERLLRPKGEIPESYEEDIVTYLRETGYEVEKSPITS